MKQIIRFVRFIRDFSQKLTDANVPSFAASAAFFILVSFFPFTMFFVTMIQFLPFTESDVLYLVSQVIPATMIGSAIEIIWEIFDETSGTFISVTLIAMLWAAAKGFYAIILGLNSVYGLRETRNYFHRMLISIGYTISFAVMLLLTMGLLLFGNQILKLCIRYFPHLLDFSVGISIFRLLFILFILTVFFLLMFLVVPNRRSRIRDEFPGALFSAVCWMGFSALYSFYIDNFSNYTRTYGSLTAIVLFMLWLYMCMYLMFIGAQINLGLKNYRETGHFFEPKTK